MGRSEAITFLGTFTPVVKDGAERDIQPKKLKIIEDPEQHAAARGQPERYESVDKKLFRTVAGLEAHNQTLKPESKTNNKGEANAEPRKRTRVTTPRR